MSFVAAAVVGSAVVGGVVASNSARHAANAQRDAANQAAGVQREALDSQEAIYQQQREDQAPYREAGYESLAALRSGMGLGNAAPSRMSGPPRRIQTAGISTGLAPQVPAQSTNGIIGTITAALSKPALVGASENGGVPLNLGGGEGGGSSFADDYDTSSAVNPGEFTRDFTLADFTADPGYAFRMSEGEKAIQRGASARGLNLSGATLKALNRFNSGNAAQEYGSAFDRFNVNRTNKFNRLSTLAGIGQTANAQTSAAGSQYGNAVGNYASGMSSNLAAIGNASAANSIAQGNAVSGTLNGLANNYMTYQLLKG